VSPNFDKDFILYTFSFENGYEIALTQNKDEGNEVPIAFISSLLQGSELKYPEVDM